MNGLKEILDRLKIEQLNPMQEASIEAFNKGGETDIAFAHRFGQDPCFLVTVGR